MSENYYDKSASKNIFQLKELAPDQLKAFQQFDAAVLKAGALSKKEKEIIAVAIAHVTECPYCIDTHTKKAKVAGATLEELVEAVFVTMAIEAGGVVTHSTHVHNANLENSPDELYTRSNLRNLKELNKYAPDGFKGYSNFSQTAMKEGKLSAKFKEIIAVAVATATQCPYCIDVHTKNALKLGATNEELAEAILVSSALCAGGAYAHMINMIQSYNE
ncbi:carboxymuconolactone decarboxylase family protein [Ureibacillus acetophenoni]|uniref:AhpD family alkylhydroperoxidase n=1 Tax=Ureibacillus acetophenoni TaxID=614649 RepID=A0A285UG29_9BACL|nr:carboxymuconolactone decarboxylase family protein [Ureibacillus acetophenoni]SOC40723.1 AhpD family alkylhydroperoxidase [Ureibacillus acetophenoni]